MFNKTSVLLSTFFMTLGFIPLGICKPKNISYEIHTDSINRAILIKEELIDFYKENCYASSYTKIEHNIQQFLSSFPYECHYKNQMITIYENDKEICMKGILYEVEYPKIEKKLFFK